MVGKTMMWGALVLGLSLVVVGVWVRSWPDVEMGRRLTENNCGVCHDLTNKQHNEKGPFLWNVVNRPAGSINFAYSGAFLALVRKKPFVWDETHLDEFIANPADFIPSTRMVQRSKSHPLAFEGIESTTNRRDVIAYLSTLKNKEK